MMVKFQSERFSCLLIFNSNITENGAFTPEWHSLCVSVGHWILLCKPWRESSLHNADVCFLAALLTLTPFTQRLVESSTTIPPYSVSNRPFSGGGWGHLAASLHFSQYSRAVFMAPRTRCDSLCLSLLTYKLTQKHRLRTPTNTSNHFPS